MLTALLSGAVFGTVNLAHCAGMCGPLAAAGCARTGRSGLLRYQLGRSVTYVYAGALAGHLGRGLQLYGARWAGWIFALLTAAACLVSARSLFRSSSGFVQLRTSPRPRSWFATLLRLLPRDPLPLGLLSVLLPCGLLAAALLAAVASGSATSGAAFMFGFVVMSGGALLGSGLLVQAAPRFSNPLRRGLACVLLIAAVSAVAKPIAASSGEDTTAHVHHCH